MDGLAFVIFGGRSDVAAGVCDVVVGVDVVNLAGDQVFGFRD
jgi:hypothetical protein